MDGAVPTAAIEVSGVRKAYGEGPAATVALRGVSLTVEAGTFVSLIGPSGCGKSTLLRLAAGLEAPDQGTVRVHGAAPREAAAAKLIGLVPQAPALLPWLSVLKNVTLPLKVNRGAGKQRARFGTLGNGRPPADMLELLGKVGLGEVAHRLPAQLSGGMAQRAAIVRALGLQPDVLLMDEPFSALDELTRESLQDLLLDLWGELNTTVLFVTHSIAEAVRMSDVVVVMGAPGTVIESVPIALPRPRDPRLLDDPRFHGYEHQVRSSLRSAWSVTGAA
jgi:NitT/TauT family transport system ATP-binding protein